MQFSICIITNAGLDGQFHRREFLLRLIASLASAGFTEDNSEVIVSGALFDGIACTRALPLAELAESGNVCALRNQAITVARGDWIVQCDDDVIFTPGYVSALAESLTDSADIVCTRLLNPNGTRYWDWAAFIPGKGQTLLPYEADEKHVYATGGHAVYRRAIFGKIKWPESIRHGGNEEHSLAAQARERGMRFRFCKGATVFLQYHHCDAEAVVSGRKQSATDKMCKALKLLLESIQANADGKTSATVTQELSNMDSLQSVRARLGHKLATNGTQPQSIDVSIVTCCNRYLQRFRIFAQSLCRQDCDLSKVEVLVANPDSPDGLSAYLKTLKIAESAPQFADVLMDQAHWRNRGAMIQEAYLQSRGNIVIGITN